MKKKKTKKILFHYVFRYHHAITMIYTWYSFRDLVAYGRWFIAMNYSIHSIMYTYYVFRAFRFNIPKRVAITITSLQLLQMVVGIFVNIVGAFQLYTGRGSDCRVTPQNIYFSFILYLSFFLLFFHYFRNAYLKKPAGKSVTGTGGDDDRAGGVKKTKPVKTASSALAAVKLSQVEQEDKAAMNNRARFIALFKKVN